MADVVDRATLRTTLTYRVLPRLTVGLEYNPLADDVGLLANFVAMTETARRPALILGTSSERIGTESGRSIYATLSKDLTEAAGLPIAPYVGVAYGTDVDKRALLIGGMNVNWTESLSSTVIFDGVKVHHILTFSRDRHQFGFLLIEGRKPGASYSVSF